MYKIRKIKFQNHPILKNLELDFCGKDGKALDTIIFAGENGTGKSTIINLLYEVASHTVKHPVLVEFEKGEKIFNISYYLKKLGDYNTFLYANDGQGMDVYIFDDYIKKKYPFSGIFSDVDINFHASDVSTVTSLTLDSIKDSRRSTEKLPTQINQLLVDIQSIDDGELARAYRSAKELNKSVEDIGYQERMPRFTTAFNRMFEGLTYSRIENENGKKTIFFQKYGIDIPINNLSSGEKQVVYRGCFLLKDVNATNGAFVFIDEPEISLHPNWQAKIMDYYKGIFTNCGEQTSQIFVVTHSPFVIHNDTRRNDKVIILSRDDNGDIVVKDKPEYFKCNSIEAVQDAFQIDLPVDEQPVIYLEGRTDEKYFKKALEVYGYNVNFKFKWIGYIDEKGQEANTGKDALNKAVSFLIARNSAIKSVCLYDCDANKQLKEINNVIVFSIQKFENSAGINIGIENALVLDDIDIEPYRKQRMEIDGYGIEKLIPDFQKMKCCEDICNLDAEKLKGVFVNLKTVIDHIVELLDDHKKTE
ncbi:AAA family ATPase [Mediterraneibacter glycyrrhizinilyticus]|uniref:AAA family ATPase n=1 Tax=Mediterraneibacter glycyrrhizinilyticus TaxID=342942 RepID=UPI0025A32FE4|nr:ATP-binding protein [Mediterraneibacter glycyrrhizinilyticus]MDM8126596.1 ATP-binding protein [Mediterraneibacter glycyrrhizinilyticus]